MSKSPEDEYIDWQNEVRRYRFDLNNGNVIEDCVPPDIMKEIRRQQEEEQVRMMECEKHGATCDVCDRRNCLSRKNKEVN